MNNSITSQSEIIKVSKCIIVEQGMSCLNIRMVAKNCGISVGAIYNYFSSKSELLNTVIKSIWEEIFEPFNNMNDIDSFVDGVLFLFQTIKTGNEKYNNFFAEHYLNFNAQNKSKGKEIMHNYFGVLEKKLTCILANDTNVRKNVFCKDFSMEEFSSFVVTLLTSTFLKNKNNCNSLIELIKNCIY